MKTLLDVAGCLVLASLPFTLVSCAGPGESEGQADIPGGSAEARGIPEFPTLAGPYLGQPPAMSEPMPFAPGIVSGGFSERDLTMTPDGSEIYWGVTGANYVWSTVFVSRLVEGRWTEPRVAPCCTDPGTVDLEPHVTPDGRHFLWLSDRPGGSSDEPGGQDIWAMDREEEGWGDPYPLPAPVNTDASEYYPSATRDGTLYFTRGPAGGGENAVFRSRLVGGVYQEPERLPSQVNAGLNRYNAFVDPDERFLILGVVGMDDTVGGTDYYIVFRNEDDRWSDPVNLGTGVNTPGTFEFSPYVSPDGEFFFFMTARPDVDALAPADGMSWRTLQQMASAPGNGGWDIYWVRSDFLDELRPPGF